MVTDTVNTAYESTNSSGFACAGLNQVRKTSKLLITIGR